MAMTNIPYGSDQAIRIQSAGLFAAVMQRNTILNRLTGPMPMQSDAENAIRVQSSNKYPIVLCKDLSKTAGDEITFDLVNPLGGKPIMGGQNAEGLGRALSFSQDKLRINQTRYPVSAGDAMTQQRTRWQLRSLARAAAEEYMNRLMDQISLVHLAGARGFHNNIEWAVPLQSDVDFASILINPVKAPTKNRHYISTGSNIEPISASGNDISIATTDVLNSDVVDGIRTVLDSMAMPPSPVIFEGDKMASDSPLRVLLVSSENYTSFVQSTNFRTLQAQAMARSQTAGGNPLFMGDAGIWNGILIVKMPKPIRFYAGDPINWCGSFYTETENTTDCVPDSFNVDGKRVFAVDRSILLGGQALATALGMNNKTGNPFFWSEKELDHGDKLEVLIGMMNGTSKIRFNQDYGSDGKRVTDQGVICIDSAVKIAGV
jgi:N4-gp56 family major capsid protein